MIPGYGIIRRPSSKTWRWLPLVLAVILAAGLLGCSDESSQLRAQEVRSEKERVTSPTTSDSVLTDLAAGNSVFAFDLYQALRGQEGNLLYSPYSISLALAMTYAGARGETELQMADTLHFLLPQDRLHPSFNALDLELASRGQGSSGRDEEGFRLNIVNAVWGQEGYKFLPEFLDILAESYGAGVRPLDFTEAREESRGIINNWVADQTEDRIKDLIPQGAISPKTRLVLTNAIYFNGAWLFPFSEEGTAEGPFYLLDGNRVEVPMMRHILEPIHFRYVDGNGYQALEMLYDGHEVSMVLLLPDPGEFSRFEGSLDAGLVGQVIKDLKYSPIVLMMPRFEFESESSLKDTLSEMGMPDAFGSADFSGMDGRKDLFIEAVVHKAVVLVDETGTEAAAATGATMFLIGNGPPTIEVTVDRPFIFLIRDVATDAILFVGRVVDPRT